MGPKKKKIVVSRGIGECLRQDWFTKDHQDELEFYTNRKKFDPEIEFVEIPHAEEKFTYPEQMQQFFGRFAENY